MTELARRTSLYRHFDEGGALLYVGVSLSALNRLGQHAEHSGWYGAIARVTIQNFDTREAALEAERSAIVRESPAHNIQHKKAAQAASKKGRDELAQALECAANAKRDLTARVVQFHPVYSLHDAADALNVNIRVVNALVRERKIGFFTMPNTSGRPVEHISGWQLIDYLEHVGGGPT
jgi:predicted GIY-YIG superfamily endonuclease